MSKRQLPKLDMLARPNGYVAEITADGLAKWADIFPQAEASGGNTISIFDVIGEDSWTGGGFTAKRAAGALRSIGPNPVTVEINSPGGDMFDGVAIYNLLREHPGEVTVKIMGLAASAASIIAMSGDRIVMSAGSMMMLHKAWGLVVGNDDTFAEAADVFAKFNEETAAIYAARSGLSVADVLAIMEGPKKGSDGTWLTAKDAIAKGLADEISADEAKREDGNKKARADLMAKRRLDALLAQQGLPRSERRRLMREATGTHDAADTAMPSAGLDLAAAAALLAAMKQ